MSKALILNCGSSSVKFKLFTIKNNKVGTELSSGLVDGIKLDHCLIEIKTLDQKFSTNKKIKSHSEAVEHLLEQLIKLKIVKEFNEIKFVGHRVVHGGEKFTKPIIITKAVIKDLQKVSELAPLHNPANLAGIEACSKSLPHCRQVAVFDTAFHQTLPEKAYLYSLPAKYHTQHKIRRYGFHGISHQFVTQEAIKLLKKKNSKIISCHLGNGSSITCSRNGNSLDTTMGFTPLEGLIMGTRCGSIDPAIVFHLAENLKMPLQEIKELLLKNSGLKGLSGISSDMRKIREASLKKDKRALLTIDILAYQIAKYCAGYLATLNGLDALVFTGGMGEKAYYLRKKICKYLEFYGIKLNIHANTASEPLISDKKSSTKIFVIPTNEELEIARQSLHLS